MNTLAGDDTENQAEASPGAGKANRIVMVQ
jgi:hypothetical protein